MAISDLVYIDSNGYHYPDYPTVLAYFQESYRAIYGSDAYLEPDSQDGQWVAIQAQAIHDMMALGASIYNAFSPSTAQGVGLSRNIKINGISRREATFSTVDLVITGQAGTTILNGQAVDTLEQRWNLPASVIIPLSGTITVTAISAIAGAFSALANTITGIATPTLGWQTVNNPLAAVVGAAAEDDAQLRRRQAVSTALPSQTVLDGIIGGVASVPGVTRYKGYQNNTSSTNSDGIPAHNIAIIAEGGDAQEIGDVIAVKKTPGVPTFGTTSVTTYDQYGAPNIINFFRPTNITITVEVDISALPGYTSSYADDIKQAIAGYINALEIGNDVYFTKLYVPANLPGTIAGSTFDLLEIRISGDSYPPATANVPIGFYESATCGVGDITITVVP